MAGYSNFSMASNVFIQSFVNNCFSVIEIVLVMTKTAKILHEFPVHQTDDRLKESISRFSLQILQEKRPISVCGMFNVDNTLLYSMISSMTSYLILLIQFQMEM
ncbi:putative gustatory receptor 28b [Phlebotomus argentipes]|uniref:putative gustatory receptor 28b n=1 Tax=Phlebotomus argentipes TaxID=94469 RepID=UPI0028933754|nr:putative gustatory receptor 28b [Phlebotomus argentipes]